MAAQVGETGLLLGVDQDDMALEAAGARLDREVPGVPHQLLKGNFGDLDELLCSAEVPGVDGFLFDLGVSSPQLEDVYKRQSDDGGQLANGICLTERGEWYLEGVRTGMLVQEMLEDEVADR